MHQFFRCVRIFERILDLVVFTDIWIRIIESRVLHHVIRRNTLYSLFIFAMNLLSDSVLLSTFNLFFLVDISSIVFRFSEPDSKTAQYLWSFLNESSPVNFIKRLIYRVDFLRISSLLIFLLVHSSGNFSLRILNISLITWTRLRSLAFLRDIMQKSKCANRQSYYDIDT